MSDNENTNDHSGNDESRRSILKKGALSSVALGLGGSAIGSAAAQEGPVGEDNDWTDEELFVEEEGMKAVMYRRQWHPTELFTIASPIIEFVPNVEGVQDNIWSDYNTRIIRYLQSDENVLLFVAHDAALGPYDEELGFVVDDDFVENGEVVLDGVPREELTDNELAQIRPTIFAMEHDFTLFGGDNYLVTVQFSPIAEELEEEVHADFEDEFGIGADGGGAGGGNGAGNAGGSNNSS